MDNRLREEQKIKRQIEWHRQNLNHLISKKKYSLTHPEVVQESQAIDKLLNRLNRLKHHPPYKQPACYNQQRNKENFN